MARRKEARTLAEKLEKLIREIPGDRVYSNDEIAQGCSAAGFGTISKTYVWQLRTGQRDNPTMRHLSALSKFFGVPAAYFFDDEVSERVDSQLALTAALRDAGIRDAALRMSGMVEADRSSIVRIVQEVTEMYRSSRPDSGSSRPGSTGT